MLLWPLWEICVAKLTCLFFYCIQSWVFKSKRKQPHNRIKYINSSTVYCDSFHPDFHLFWSYRSKVANFRAGTTSYFAEKDSTTNTKIMKLPYSTFLKAMHTKTTLLGFLEKDIEYPLSSGKRVMDNIELNLNAYVNLVRHKCKDANSKIASCCFHLDFLLSFQCDFGQRRK